MTIGVFAIISIGLSLLLSFANFHAKRIKVFLLKSLIGRFLEITIVASAFSVFLWIVTTIVRTVYGGRLSLDGLKIISDYQISVNKFLEYLPQPWIIAFIALILIVFNAYSSDAHAKKQWRYAANRIFLSAQPWLNRASVVAAVLSAFTLLYAEGTGARLWIDLEMATVKKSAESLEQEIAKLSSAASANEFYNEIAEAMSQEEWNAIVDTVHHLSALENSIRARTTPAGPTVRRAGDFVSEELHPSSSSIFNGESFSVSKDIERDYRESSADLLSRMKGAVENADWQSLGSARSRQLPSEIRMAFIELAAKAVVGGATNFLAPTQNAVVNLFAEALTEATIERLRVRATQISEAIRAAIRPPKNKPPSDFQASLKTILGTLTKVRFAAKQPSAEGILRIQAVLGKASGFENTIENEASGICPPGEVSLACEEIGGIGKIGQSFCGSPSLEHTPCR